MEEALPDNLDTGPHTCAVCGTSIYRGDGEKMTISMVLPSQTASLMENGDEVTFSEETESLQIQLCENHWSAMKEWVGDPNAVSLSSFDATQVKPVSHSGVVQETKWDQDRLRSAQSIVSGEIESYSEKEVHRLREKLQATLLLAAVYRYDIDYGPTQRAKENLRTLLHKQGYNVSRLYDDCIDIKVELESDCTVVGTVYSTQVDSKSHQRKPLSKWESEPERSVSDTVYLRLSRRSFHESAYKKYSDCTYVGFYWLQDREKWLWYPIPEGISTEFGSDDRLLLPIEGPTGESPALGLNALSSETIAIEEYEQRLKENWAEIEKERPMSERATDWLRRYFQ